MRALALALLLGLCACTGPTRTVRLVAERRAGDASVPVPGAHVRATPLGTNDLPLPLTLETLEQYLTAVGDSSSADAQGRARLRLYAKAAHLIELYPPIVGELADQRTWVWVLTPDGRSLLPVDEPGFASLDASAGAQESAPVRTIELRLER